MISDLINGRDMLERMHIELCDGIKCDRCTMCTEDGGCMVEEWIDRFPSADGVIHGKWAEKQVKDESPWTRRRFYCSACGSWNTYGLSKYCPDCGAKMDGERKESE